MVVLHTYDAQLLSRLRFNESAEVGLLDLDPSSAPTYRVEYSLRAHLFEEPHMGERTR
jgi:hypothetical protein